MPIFSFIRSLFILTGFNSALQMPSLESSSPLLFQPFFSDDVRSSGTSHASPGSPLKFSSDSTQHEIVESQDVDEEYDEEDAAFCAQVEAFARKCDTHQLAVDRLVQDLVEDDELEASKKLNNASLGMEAPPQEIELGSKSGKASNEAKSVHVGTENNEGGSVSVQTSLTNGTSDSQSATEHDKRMPKKANHRSGLTQNGKNSHKLGQVSSKRSIHPIKERAQDKNLSQSPSKPLAAASILTKSPNSSSVKTPIVESSDILTGPISTSKRLLHARKPAGGFRPAGDNESSLSIKRNGSSIRRENPDLGPPLLKLAKKAIALGEKPRKALEYAEMAVKAYEDASDGKYSLDLVMSLHVLAALHCSLGQFEEAVKVLEHSLSTATFDIGVQEHALAAFAGYMQLGDTFALLGKGEEALSAYCVGLDVQMGTLGEKDPRVGETCRYLAEAHAQVNVFSLCTL